MYYNTPKVKWWMYCKGCGWESPKKQQKLNRVQCPKCSTLLHTITEDDSLKELLRHEKAKQT